MVSFSDILFLSAVMGLTIYLSMPILFRSVSDIKIKLLNAVAIGILIFLMGDVFSDVTIYLYNGSLYGYGTVPQYDITFFVSMVAGFLVLHTVSSRSRHRLTPEYTSIIIATGIGFQNLTEGLVFGSLGSVMGLNGIVAVVLVGFALQNATEGFPIASPFFSIKKKSWITLSLIFLIGGLPTILGGATGYYYRSTFFDIIFDGIAIGSILFVILPMLQSMFMEQDRVKLNITYLGILTGFALGFLVNII
jgi:ZIP family zinc transporter